MRLVKLIGSSLKKDLEEVTKRLRQHSKDVDSTAIALELLKAAEFREGKGLGSYSLGCPSNPCTRATSDR